MRLVAFFLSLALLVLAPALPGKAETPLPPAPTVLLLSNHADSAELSLADRWILRMAEMRERRQGIDAWLIPGLLGGAALGGAATVLAPGLTTQARIVTGVSAGIAAAGMVAALLDKPEKKGRWFAIAGGLFAMAYGGAGVVDSLVRRNDDGKGGCNGWCFNEKSIGWLGGAFVVQGLALMPLAFVSRGPSIRELRDYQSLSPRERPIRARKLLSRIDRDERKANLLALINGLIGVAAFGTGAALVKDRGNRMTLLGFGGFTLGSNMLTTVPALLTKSRLERFVDGEEPAEKEHVIW
jgi:MFS family permease